MIGRNIFVFWRKFFLGRLYDIKVEEEKKLIFATAGGIFNIEDSKNYLSDFQTVLNTINPKDYTLIVDVTKLTVNKSLVEDITFLLNMYTFARFKKMIVVNPLSVASKYQIHAIAKDIEYQGIFVNNVEEAFSFL